MELVLTKETEEGTVIPSLTSGGAVAAVLRAAFCCPLRWSADYQVVINQYVPLHQAHGQTDDVTSTNVKSS